MNVHETKSRCEMPCCGSHRLLTRLSIGASQVPFSEPSDSPFVQLCLRAAVFDRNTIDDMV